MYGHLRQILPNKSRVRDAAIGHLGLIVQIPARYSPKGTESVLDVGLNSADPRPAEILLLRQGGGQRDVRHRILYSIVEPGRASGQVAHRRNIDSGLPAEQTLWS